MKATLIPKPKLDYDPYDEDCCGAHLGDVVIVDCGDLKINIKETRSGLGPSYTIDIDAGQWGSKSKALVVFIDDDGTLYVGPPL